MIPLLAGAGLAGLAGSPHCIGMCGGFATASAGNPRAAAAWHAGRLTTYATLGAVAGATGAAVPGPPWVSSGVAAVLLVWFAARLAGIAPAPHLRIPGLSRLGGALARRPGVLPRYAFGLVTALLPCGLVYAGLALPVALADPLAGAAAMVLFGLGTVPALSFASAGLRRLAALRPGARRLVAALVLAAGLWSVGARTAVADDAAPSCHEQP